MPLPVRFVAPREKKEPKRSGHQPGTCITCGLRSYRRMSDRERRAHDQKHKDVAKRG